MASANRHTGESRYPEPKRSSQQYRMPPPDLRAGRVTKALPMRESRAAAASIHAATSDPHPLLGRSLSAVSSIMVTGPSLQIETVMWAWKRPVSTRRPVDPNISTVLANSLSASSGGAALEKLGRRPLRVAVHHRRSRHSR